jgi:hypothetical protein
VTNHKPNTVKTKNQMKIESIFKHQELDLMEASFSTPKKLFQGLSSLILSVVFLPDLSQINRLENTISGALFGYQKVKGNYGDYTSCLQVNNMTKTNIMEFGNRFHFHSFIYCARFEEEERVGMTIQWIKSPTQALFSTQAELVGERIIYFNREQDGFYWTEIKGQKFELAFLDHATPNDNFWNKGRISGTHQAPSPGDLTDKDHQQIELWIKGSLVEGKMVKWNWMRRGMIGNLMNSYRN